MLKNIRLATFFVLAFSILSLIPASQPINVKQMHDVALMEVGKSVVTKTKKELDNARRAINCLALNIYFEARGEPFLGQVAVARVVMNRVNDGRFPKNACGVIYQHTEVIDPETNEPKKICQFSWACDRVDLPGLGNQSYQQALKIAKAVVLENKWAEIIDENILFFHNKAVNPGWNLQHVITIGNHKFFNDEKKVDNKSKQ